MAAFVGTKKTQTTGSDNTFNGSWSLTTADATGDAALVHHLHETDVYTFRKYFQLLNTRSQYIDICRCNIVTGQDNMRIAHGYCMAWINHAVYLQAIFRLASFCKHRDLIRFKPGYPHVYGHLAIGL